MRRLQARGTAEGGPSPLPPVDERERPILEAVVKSVSVFPGGRG